MINNELHYLKYIVSDIFGHCCGDIMELILLYGNKLTINEMINLSNYEFCIVRNVLLCLLIHNIVDIQVIYSKSHECNHILIPDSKKENFLSNEKNIERDGYRGKVTTVDRNDSVKYIESTHLDEVVEEMVEAMGPVGVTRAFNIATNDYGIHNDVKYKGDIKDETKDGLTKNTNINEQIRFLTEHEHYKYMKGCSCPSCICKIKRVEYFVIVNNIYTLVRYSSILYYMHPTQVKGSSNDDILEHHHLYVSTPAVDTSHSTSAPRNKSKNMITSNVTCPDTKTHNLMHNMSYNFFTSNILCDNNSIAQGEVDNNNVEETFSKGDLVHFIEKVILLRIIKNGRITIDTCLKNLKHDDYVEVCKKEIPNIKKKKLRLIFLQLLKKKFIKKCKYFNEHACENDSNTREHMTKYSNSINYMNACLDPTLSSTNNCSSLYHLNPNNEITMNKLEQNTQKINTSHNSKNKIYHNAHSNYYDMSKSNDHTNPSEFERNNHFNNSHNSSNDSFLFTQVDNINDMNSDNCTTISNLNDKNKHNGKTTRNVLNMTSNMKRRKIIDNQMENAQNFGNLTNNNDIEGNIFSISGDNNRTSDLIDYRRNLNDDNNNNMRWNFLGNSSHVDYGNEDIKSSRNVVHFQPHNAKTEEQKNPRVCTKSNEYEYFDTNYNSSGRYINKENMENDIMEYLDNRFTYFQANNEVLTILYLKQECFNFITHYYSFNEIGKYIFFFLLNNVQLSYCAEENNYKDISIFCSFENIEKYVIENLKKKNIYIDRNIVLQNLNNLIKYPDQLIKTQRNETITYAADFENVKNIYKNKIITNFIESMNGISALRIWKFLASAPSQKVNDEIISENVLIPLNDVRKKLYNLLYHGYIKCHECNNSNVNKTYIKHSLSFSTNIYYTTNKIKENLFTIAKNIYIRKLHENNEINILHNKSNICANDMAKESPSSVHTNQVRISNEAYNPPDSTSEKKKKISLTSREYAVDYLEISLINLDKLIFIFNS
ncbi:hypothetical protein, conserved [Plasmodium gonderi]|uniref:DNA-directed RNA polymerase III subunit RPC3 n=1 Tax=Plasmodium gonderi TaxID=77519 RepID=A0A1Y1JFA2_PLAGO|nr:hypothetical protein, conserved [Plasmodium gonderi]GAW81219.1 hypothetical protein, conserved [Plasmodium gonderi]